MQHVTDVPTMLVYDDGTGEQAAIGLMVPTEPG
jgi:hypothetical protein